MDTIRPNPRRNFLVAASLGAAAVAAVAAQIGPQAAAATATAPAQAPGQSGYRASPHILTYYRTTAF